MNTHLSERHFAISEKEKEEEVAFQTQLKQGCAPVKWQRGASPTRFLCSSH